MDCLSPIQKRAMETLVSMGWSDQDFEYLIMAPNPEKVLKLIRTEIPKKILEISSDEAKSILKMPFHTVFNRANLISLGFSNGIWTRASNVIRDTFIERRSEPTIGNVYSLDYVVLMGQKVSGRVVYLAIQAILREKCGLVNPEWKVFRKNEKFWQ